MTNAGLIEALSGALAFNNGLTQGGSINAALIINGGTISGTTLTLNSGELRGAGTITANIVNTGATVSPGDTGSIGLLTIDGNYTQSSTAALYIKIDGPAAGEFDALSVSGTATLGGALNVTLRSFFTPIVGDSVEVLSATTQVNPFDSINGAGLLTASYSAGNVYLVRNALTFTWIGSASTDWFNPVNWSLGEVPTSGDSVLIGSGATVALNGTDATVAGFDQTGGAFLGTANLTVKDTFNWIGGSQAGTGSTILDATVIAGIGGTATATRTFINSGSLTLANTTSFSTFIQNGSAAELDFSAASTSGAFTLNGGKLDGTGAHTAGSFTNNGAIIRPGGISAIGTLRLYGFSQNSFGTLEIELAGATPGDFDVLALTGASTLGGGLYIDTIAPFNPGVGNTFRVITTPALPSGDFAAFTGDVTRLTRTVDGSGVLLTSTTLTFVWDNDSADNDWLNPLNWDRNSGTPGSADTAVINIPGTINLNSSLGISALSQSNGTLTGAGALAVSDVLTWSGGTINLLVTTSAISINTLGGNVAMTLDSALLDLNGTTSLGGTIDISLTGTNAELRNSGIFDFISSAGITGSGAFHNFASSGGVIKSGSAGVTISTAFLNGTTLNVTDGTLTLGGGGNWLSNASASVGTSGFLIFNGGTHTFAGDNLFTGIGTTRLDGATIDYSGQLTVAPSHHFEQISGLLGGPDSFIIAGSFLWSGGTQYGPGSTLIASPNDVSYISGSANKTLDGRSLIVSANSALVIDSDTSLSLKQSGLLLISGSLTLASSAGVNDGASPGASMEITPGGTVTKTTSATSFIGLPFTSTGSLTISGGTLNFQSTFTQNAGTTILSGGDIGFASTAELYGGALSGSGTIIGNVNNNAAYLQPGNGVGALTINGDYTQSSGGTLEIEVGASGPILIPDSLFVTGSATLGGTLNFNLPVNYSPSVGDTFFILSYGSHSGSFASVNLPPDFIASYGATGTSVVLPFLTPGTIRLSDIDSQTGFTVPALAAGDAHGFSITSLGDINADTFGDFAIGAPAANSAAGITYVIFGKATGFGSTFDVLTLDGTNGFVVLGGQPDDYSGESVRSAGDINGDQIPDMLITTQNTAYVIYGKSGPFSATLSLQSLTAADGFQITGFGTLSNPYLRLNTLGDVNGDGKGDIAIGVPYSGSGGRGAVYVIFGGDAQFPLSLDVSTLDGTNGFAMTGEAPGDHFGFSIAGAGDMNGDGRADILIGAPDADSAEFNNVGAVYVVFGKKALGATPIDLATLRGNRGFKIEGLSESASLGFDIASAGDMNGDKLADILIGAGNFSNVEGASPRANNAYVIFGNSATSIVKFDLTSLNGTNGFALSTDPIESHSGFFVSGVGDFNGDGFADILLGSPDTAKGTAYLMYGRKTGYLPELNLDTLNGTNGLRFIGQSSSTGTSQGLGGGDINGDGAADLFITAPYESNGGTAYVIFGNPSAKALPTSGGSGTTLTFSDDDDDTIIVKVTGGKITSDMLTFGADGGLQLLDLTAGTFKDGANITFTVKKGPTGDGIINVGAINAEGIKLGTVKITGDLGQIDVGNGDPLKPALKSLIVGSIGAMGGSTQTPGTEDPLNSNIQGALPKLIVKGVFTNATLNILGKLGTATIGGEFTGTGAFSSSQLAGLAKLGHGNIGHVSGGITLVSSGLSAGSIGKLNIKQSITNAAVNSSGSIGSTTIGGSVNKSAIVSHGPMKVVKIFGSITSDDLATPSVIAALATPPSSKPSSALAINNLTVKGDVRNAEILLGYNSAFAPLNGDASVGKVTITGSFIASSLVAGVKDTTADGFGRGDLRIGSPDPDPTPTIVSRIASLVIKGTIEGTPTTNGDSFGITAQQIKKATISGVKIVLDKLALDDKGFGTQEDVRLVEVL